VSGHGKITSVTPKRRAPEG